jgi:hypothetical protein
LLPLCSSRYLIYFGCFILHSVERLHMVGVAGAAKLRAATENISNQANLVLHTTCR